MISTLPPLHCGEIVITSVKCASETCIKKVQSQNLKCCEVESLFFNPVVTGALNPIEISVSGVLLGCASNSGIAAFIVAGEWALIGLILNDIMVKLGCTIGTCFLP